MDAYFWFCICVSINGLILLALSGYVTSLRRKYKVSVGDGGNNDLLRAMRTHANGVEQALIYSLLILGMTFLGCSNKVLAALVLVFIFSRMSHAVGMIYRVLRARQLGAGLTFNVLTLMMLARYLDLLMRMSSVKSFQMLVGVFFQLICLFSFS